jgi:hypothetical protein
LSEFPAQLAACVIEEPAAVGVYFTEYVLQVLCVESVRDFFENVPKSVPSCRIRVLYGGFDRSPDAVSFLILFAE